MAIEKVSGRGIYHGDLISLCQVIRTKFVGLTAKLDLDNTDTDYAALWNFAAPDPNQMSLVGGYRDQGVLLAYLKTVRTGFNGVLAKLDLDTAVADTDYNSLLNIADKINTGTNLADLNGQGMNQGALVKWLTTYVTNFNALLTKLDADGTVTDADYNSLWNITATLVLAETGNLLKVGG